MAKIFYCTFRSLHTKTNSLPHNLDIPCYKYGTRSSRGMHFVLNQAMLLCRMRNEMKVRCSSSFVRPRKPLSSSGIGRIYCADSQRDNVTVRSARQRRDVTGVDDVSESGPLTIDFSSANRHGNPVPLGTTANQVMAKHKTRLKVPQPDDSTGRHFAPRRPTTHGPVR